MLRAVVTQAGESFSVRLTTTVPPTTPVDQATTTTTATTTTVPGEVRNDITITGGGAVAKDGTAVVSEEQAAPGPNPIMPEVKEVVWGAGAFIVFAVIMRYVAFPRLKKGMDARYAGIRSDHEQADASRAAAQAEVADYQAQLARVKAEAAARLDVARQQLEAERTERITAANAQIAEQRAVAAAQNEAARAAVQGQIHAAVADVSSSAIRLAVGKAPDVALVDRVVNDVMGAEVSR